MGVYQITYAPKIEQICLYLDGGCDFHCHGCISRFHLEACYFYGEIIKRTHNKILSLKETLRLIEPLSVKSAVFLGQEPTRDSIFLPLAEILKKKYSAYNAVITNCWRYIDEAVDEVCGSIKAVTQRVFREFTGRDNPLRVLENFKRYANNPGIKLKAETIYVPGLVTKDEIRSIAAFIGSVDSGIPYRIDAYIPIGTYFPEQTDRFRKPTQDEMDEAKKTAEGYLKNVSILTREVKPKFGVRKIY